MQALLRYLYTIDPTQIYRASDPLFSDVERDLDVLAIADKYGIDPLRNYMLSQLVTFFEIDNYPPSDRKESAKNREGFRKVVRKIGELDCECAGRIRTAIASFIVRRDQMILRWGILEELLEEGAWLGCELATMALKAKGQADARIKELEWEVREVEAERDEVLELNDELEWQVEDLGEQAARNDWMTLDEEWEDQEMRTGHRYSEEEYGDHTYYVDEGFGRREIELAEEFETVEDVLSGITYCMGEDGPVDVDDGPDVWLASDDERTLM